MAVAFRILHGSSSQATWPQSATSAPSAARRSGTGTASIFSMSTNRPGRPASSERLV